MAMKECYELGDRYEQGEAPCSSYLDDAITFDELSIELKKIKLVNVLFEVKWYLPTSSRDVIADKESGVKDLSDDGEENVEKKYEVLILKFVKY